MPGSVDSSGCSSSGGAAVCCVADSVWEEGGLDGELILNQSRYAQEEREADQWGNETAVHFRDVDGALVLREGGFASLQARWKRGLLEEQSYHGLAGEPVVAKDRGYHLRKAVPDKWGTIAHESYHGIVGEPMLTREGIASRASIFNERGQLLEERYFGVEGEPVTFSYSGYHRIVHTWQDGNLVASQVWGVDEEPTVTEFAWHRFTIAYDPVRNLRTEVTWYGLDGEPVGQCEGVAQIRFGYDERGNPERVSYYGSDLRPILGPHGYFEYRSHFNERGQLMERSYYGVDGSPMVAASEAAHLVKMEYDRVGNVSEVSYWGVNPGEPVVDLVGVHRYHRQHDQFGRVVEERHFGPEDKKVLSNGVFLSKTEYLRDGKTVTKYGVDERPVIDNLGLHRVENRREEGGRRMVESYFGVNGEEVLRSDSKVHRVERWNDSFGYPKGERYFALKGRKTSGAGGTHWAESTYDFSGKQVSMSYRNAEENLIEPEGIGWARVARKYDRYGNLVQEIYFGADGKPIKSAEHDAYGLRMMYDSCGRREGLHSIEPGGDGQYTDAKEFFMRIWGYTREGKVEYERYANQQGMADDPATRIHMTRFAYDQWGNWNERRYKNTDRKPTDDQHGVYLTKRLYNASGLLREESYFDIEEKKMTHPEEGYHSVVYSYDPFRRINRRMFFLEDGSAGRLSSPVHSFVYRYDQRGRVARQESYAALGERVEDPATGYAVVVREYRPQGEMTLEEFLGVDGELIEGEAGYARLMVSYDAYGRQIELQTFGEDKKPKMWKGGASSKIGYDEETGGIKTLEIRDEHGRILRKLP